MYIRKAIFSPLPFVVLASITIIGLNVTPLFLQAQHAPEGRTYNLIHNNAQDYYFYQSLMNQGADGELFTRDPYTTEPHEESFIFSYFLWLGKLSSVLGMAYPYMYHGIRLIGGILLIILSFLLIRLIRVPYPRLTFLFFLFASPLMRQINDNGKIVSVPFMNWWTAMDPIRRISYLPHHMVGNVLLVGMLYTLIRFMTHPQKRHIVFFVSSFLILSFIHPPSLFILLLIIPSSIVLFALGTHFRIHHGVIFLKKVVIEKQTIIKVATLFCLLALGLISLLFMVSQTGKGFPWSQYIAWEKNQQFPLGRELIGALGILFPMALIGIVPSVLSRRFDRILVASWFAIPLLLIPLAPTLQISNIRLVQGVPYLPLAILATFGIQSLIDIISKLSSRAKSRDPVEMLRRILISSGLAQNDALRKICNLRFALPAVTLFLFTIFTYPTITWSLQDQIREFWPIFGNIYLDNRLYNAFLFINTNFPKRTHALGTFYTGNYLPAFTHTVSFVGHTGYTYNNLEKEKLARKFFENKMTDSEAKEFLLTNTITLIFQGPEEKPIYPNYLYPTILKPVYDKEEVTIYTLQ